MNEASYQLCEVKSLWWMPDGGIIQCVMVKFVSKPIAPSVGKAKARAKKCFSSSRPFRSLHGHSVVSLAARLITSVLSDMDGDMKYPYLVQQMELLSKEKGEKTYRATVVTH